jgi:hypothetical protein
MAGEIAPHGDDVVARPLECTDFRLVIGRDANEEPVIAGHCARRAEQDSARDERAESSPADSRQRPHLPAIVDRNSRHLRSVVSKLHIEDVLCTSVTPVTNRTTSPAK